MGEKSRPVQYATLVNQRLCHIERLLGAIKPNPSLPELETLAFQLQRLIGCFLNELTANSPEPPVVTDFTSMQTLWGKRVLPPEVRELLLADEGFLMRWENGWQKRQQHFESDDSHKQLIASSNRAKESTPIDLASCQQCFQLLQACIERQRQHITEW